jgi:hypothetical protein
MRCFPLKKSDLASSFSEKAQYGKSQLVERSIDDFREDLASHPSKSKSWTKHAEPRPVEIVIMKRQIEGA